MEGDAREYRAKFSLKHLLLAVVALYAVLAISDNVRAILNPGRSPATKTMCLSNVKQLGISMLMYSEQNNDRLPVATAWMDEIQPLLAADLALHCPSVWREDANAYGYAMNRALSSNQLAKVGDATYTPLAFDSVALGRNAAGGQALLPQAGRHSGLNNVVFADGHAKSLSAGRKWPVMPRLK